MDRQVKVIIERDGKYLLLRRKDDEKKEHKGNWECAGGKIEKEESFEKAAIREAKEETNLDINIKKVVKEIKKDNEIIAVVFLAKPISCKVSISNEHSEFGWFSYKELRELEPITYKDFFLELIELSQSDSQMEDHKILSIE